MNILEFFKQQITVAVIYGIPVKIDYRWFFVFAILIWLTASNLSPSEVHESQSLAIFVGFVTTTLLFISIFLHELAHAFAARYEGIETREIVLHPFGGLARLSREPDNPTAEFRIAIAGPAMSFLIGLIFLIPTLVFGSLGSPLSAKISFFLCFGNILLAIFNMFPGYPLDGGRVLRAFLWKRGNDLNEATRLTGRCGQIIAVALITFGLIITLWRGDVFTGLWTVLVGLFLIDSANGIIKHSLAMDLITVGEVMSVPVFVNPEAVISQFIDNTLPLFRQTVFLVAQERRLHGILTLEDLKPVPRERWTRMRVKEVMRPVNEDLFVDSSTLLKDARELMRLNGVGALGIVDQRGTLVGYLQRGKIRRRT